MDLNRVKSAPLADPEYDVVVVGARAAGAATAMLLAQRGARVLVIDRSAEGSDTLSTHALMRAGVLQLRRWGLLDRVMAAGTPAIRHTAFHYGNVVTNVTLKPVAGVDALFAPRRTVLDPLLVDAARQAGADVRIGVSMVDLLHDDDGRVAGVVAQGPDGPPVAVRATVTVGADGLHSRTARLVQAPVERRGRHGTAVVYGYVDGLERHSYRWFFQRGVSTGVIPTNEGAACVFVGTTPSRFRREIAPDVNRGFRQLALEAAPELAAAPGFANHVGRLRSFPGAAGVMRKPWGPGWALVGDAGHFKDPLSSHGITDALRDAELLTDAIEQSLIDRRAEHDAMSAFHDTRNALSIGLFDASDRLASHAWDGETVEPLLRAMSAAMTDEVAMLAERDLCGALADAV
jgi:2-polyprenyl-6-methoxyphenol hydroxylase-like FAD-dependent oxidoreductase